MTMQDDQQMIKNIASGEPFDPVQAIRALARNANANAPAKEAPAAVMDAGPSTNSGTGPIEAAAKKRAPKDTTAQE